MNFILYQSKCQGVGIKIRTYTNKTEYKKTRNKIMSAWPSILLQRRLEYTMV